MRPERYAWLLGFFSWPYVLYQSSMIMRLEWRRAGPSGSPESNSSCTVAAPAWNPPARPPPGTTSATAGSCAAGPQGRGHARGRPAGLGLAQQPQRMQPRAYGPLAFGQVPLLQGGGRVGVGSGNDGGTGHGAGSGDRNRDSIREPQKKQNNADPTKQAGRDRQSQQAQADEVHKHVPLRPWPHLAEAQIAEVVFRDHVQLPHPAVGNEAPSGCGAQEPITTRNTTADPPST